MKIKSVRAAGTEPVYNMTVDEFHNYLIHGGIILKNCDAARYFAVTRTLGAEMPEMPVEQEADAVVDYDEAMCGGEMPEGYLQYG